MTGKLAIEIASLAVAALLATAGCSSAFNVSTLSSASCSLSPTVTETPARTFSSSAERLYLAILDKN